MKTTLGSILKPTFISKNPDGFILSLGFIAIVLAAFYFFSHPNIAVRNEEISARAYVELSDLASKSCSGSRVLKEIVGKGPIMGPDFQNISDELKRLEAAQQTQEARAKITSTSVACV